MNINNMPKLGFILLCTGLLGFLADAIISFTPLVIYDNGSLPAASMFMVLVGFCFCFPTMLQDDSGSVSTMRIVVFSVVLVFCVIYTKMAWTTASFSTFMIDKSWIYILGLAFGSKAVQKFGEQNDSSGTSNSAPAQTQPGNQAA